MPPTQIGWNLLFEQKNLISMSTEYSNTVSSSRANFFREKNKRILIEQSDDFYVIVIIPFCFAVVWSGLLDLVLRKSHKCAVNVKLSLNLSGMDLALPSCWPLLRYNIASCENHFGSLAFKDLCPRPNWTENNVFVVKIIQNLVRVTILFLEAVEAKHRCKTEKRTTDKIQITCDILMSSTQPNQGTISHQILNHKEMKWKEEETHRAILWCGPWLGLHSPY